MSIEVTPDQPLAEFEEAIKGIVVSMSCTPWGRHESLAAITQAAQKLGDQRVREALPALKLNHSVALVNEDSAVLVDEIDIALAALPTPANTGEAGND